MQPAFDTHTLTYVLSYLCCTNPLHKKSPSRQQKNPHPHWRTRATILPVVVPPPFVPCGTSAGSSPLRWEKPPHSNGCVPKVGYARCASNASPPGSRVSSNGATDDASSQHVALCTVTFPLNLSLSQPSSSLVITIARRFVICQAYNGAYETLPL